MGCVSLWPREYSRPSQRTRAPFAWLCALPQPPPREANRSGPGELPCGRQSAGDRCVMTQQCRLAGLGLVDRSRPLRFRFDDRLYEGFAGDTLASALLANGVHLVGRSFKYHRPRGILGSWADEPNALVTIIRGSGRVKIGRAHV